MKHYGEYQGSNGFFNPALERIPLGKHPFSDRSDLRIHSTFPIDGNTSYIGVYRKPERKRDAHVNGDAEFFDTLKRYGVEISLKVLKKGLVVTSSAGEEDYLS